MRMELTLVVEVDGDYIPGSVASRLSDGTWEPGEGGAVGNLSVTLSHQDITDLLDADALECAEEAWLEAYENTL